MSVTAIGGILGGLVIVMVTLAKVVEHYVFKNDKRETEAMMTEIKEILDRVENIENRTNQCVAMHEKTDEDGIPLWYMPRSFMSSIKTMVDTQKDIAFAIKTQTAVLERLDRKLEKD